MSLVVRLTLTYLLLTLAGIMLLGAAFTTLAQSYLAGQRERELLGQAEIAAALLGELAETPTELQAIAPGALSGSLLPAGTVVRVFSTGGALLMGDPALGPFPSRAALALVQPPLPLPASQAVDRQYVARPIPGPAAGLGVIEFSRSTAADTQLLRTLRRLTLQAAAVAALVMSLASVLVARTIARPIVRLTRRAEQISTAVGGGQGGAGPGRGGARETRTGALHTPSTLDSLQGQGARGPGGQEIGTGVLHAPPARSLTLHPPRDEIAQLSVSLDQLEGQLRARMARIAELEEARGRFYRSVSHELRTPLTALRGALENMADRAPAAEQAAFGSMEAEVLRLSRLVDELLTPPADGRLLPAERRPVDLGALVADLCALLSGRAERAGLELRGAVPAGLVVLGDRDRIKQALLNLLDNALRVTPAGGRVRVDAAVVGGSVQIAVTDSGPGVPGAQIAQIWARGQRGGPATAGSAGLGLAIVREIVASHGGRAFLDERHMPGARFVVELPLRDGSARPNAD